MRIFRPIIGSTLGSASLLGLRLRAFGVYLGCRRSMDFVVLLAIKLVDDRLSIYDGLLFGA